MQRKHGIAICTSGFGACIGCLSFFLSPLLAYLGLAFLTVATILYLIPESEGGKSLVFPQTHPYFRYLQRLNLASVPITFVFFWLGIWAATRSSYALLAILATVRIAVDEALSNITHRRKRGLVESTPTTKQLSQIPEKGFCKAVGYVHQTRARYRFLGEAIHNVWLVDRSVTKLFLPSVKETRGITEPLSEGAVLFAVGPTTKRFGITALQPIACAVLPAGTRVRDVDWFDRLWEKYRLRRILHSAMASALYLVAVAVLSLAILGPGGRTNVVTAISSFSAAFQGLHSHKHLKESAAYEVSGYFEPTWRALPTETKERRLRTLRQLVQLGRIPEEYLRLLETAGDLL